MFEKANRLPNGENDFVRAREKFYPTAFPWTIISLLTIHVQNLGS